MPMRPALAALALLVSTAAAAQEFELDLTDKPPAAPPEFRPVLLVVSVVAADKEDVSASRARQLEAELLKQLAQGELFQTVVEPSLAKSQLGAGYAEATECLAYACFDAAAKKTKAHRALRLTVQKHHAGSLVTAYGFDPALNEVLTAQQDSGEKAEKVFLGVAGKTQAQKDREFMKKMIPFLSTLQQKLSTPNGKISIDSAESSAVVTIDGAEVGAGTLETVVQRGPHVVKVVAKGFKPFETNVTVDPVKTAEVKVGLVAIALEVPVVVKPVEEKPSVFVRPGLYVAVAGAIAVGVGIALGQSATGVADRVGMGGDPVAVTRAEAKAAPTNALMANILVGAGAAMVVGGATWFFITPTKGGAAPPPKPTGVGEPVESATPASTSGGWMLGVGGTF